MLRRFMMILMVMALPAFLTACPDEDGPLEDAAEEVEEGMEDAGDAVEDATDN